MEHVPFPPARTVLVSAGPRAGKSALLQHWQGQFPGPAGLLRLTPEDAQPSFLKVRLRSQWPEVHACVQDLEAEVLGSSWGALFGLAMGLRHPDACLLLDDWHLIEGTPAQQELLALFRHFPASGTLVIASRHLPPHLDRLDAVLVDGDALGWSEHPRAFDLRSLPPELSVEVHALALLGAGPPSPHAAELIRRRIAAYDPATQRLVLRGAWHHATEEAMRDLGTRTAWETLDTPIWELARRFQRRLLKRSIYGDLENLPYQVRQRHPILLKLEGDHLLATRELELARGCYASALQQNPADPVLRTELALDLLEVALASHECARAEEKLSKLRAERETLPLRQQARLCNLEGRAAWCHERAEEAARHWHEVLRMPASGDRSMHAEHMAALINLHAHELQQGNLRPARHHADHMVALGTRHHFEQDLLSAHAARLDCLIADPATVPSIRTMLDIPDEAFLITPVSCFDFVLAFARRYCQLSQFEVARRLFTYLRVLCLSQRLITYLPYALLGLLDCSWKLGHPEEGWRIYDELASLPTFGGVRACVKRSWAKILAQSERADEALAMLAEEDRHMHEGPLRQHLHFTEALIRYRAGDVEALARMREILQEPTGQFLWNVESQVLAELGFRLDPVKFAIKTFGPLGISGGGTPATSWSRKKALSLLAHLTLHPNGLPSDELASKLFQGEGTPEALHAVAYHLRQSLKPIGGEDLVESTRGHYRLRWVNITFCDRMEFEELLRRGQALELADNAMGAAICYQLALMLAPDPFLEGMGDEFAPERARLDEQRQAAREFLAARRTLLFAVLPEERVVASPRIRTERRPR